MADGDKISFLLDLDAEEFSSKITESVEYIKNLQEELGKVATVAGVVGAAYLALKTSLELTFQSEELASLEAQFKSLSEQAGVSGERILQGMKKASDGLIDTSDLMKIANRSIVQLGDSATRIPEIMDIARKASIVFGGSVEQAFESISQAIATGQTRQLRQYGVVVDSQKAYRDYAASIGVAENALSKHGQVVAIQNAVLPQLQEKVAGIDKSLKGTTDAWTKLKVAVNEVGESLAKAIGPAASPVWTSALNAIAAATNGVAERFTAVFGREGAEKTSATISIYESRLADLKKQLQDLNASGEKQSIWDNLFGLKKTPTELKADLEQRIQSAEGVLALQREKLGKQGGEVYGPDAPTSGAGQDKADKEQLKRNQAAFYAELNALRTQDLQNRIAIENTMAQVDEHAKEQRLQVEEKFQQDRRAIRNNPAYDPTQKYQLEVQAERNKAAQIESIDRQVLDRKLKALDEEAKKSESVSKSIVLLSKKQSLETAKDQSVSYKVSEAGLNSFKKNFQQSFKELGAGQKSFADATKAIFFGMLGDMAAKYGEYFMALYIGSYFTDFGALAGSAAMFALAGALGSLAGGGSSGGGGGGSPGSVGGATDSLSLNDPSTPSPSQAQQQKKSIHIEVHGHIFDTPQTGMRLAEIIRDVQGATDVKIT